MNNKTLVPSGPNISYLQILLRIFSLRLHSPTILTRYGSNAAAWIKCECKPWCIINWSERAEFQTRYSTLSFPFQNVSISILHVLRLSAWWLLPQTETEEVRCRAPGTGTNSKPSLCMARAEAKYSIFVRWFVHLLEYNYMRKWADMKYLWLL